MTETTIRGHKGLTSVKELPVPCGACTKLSRATFSAGLKAEKFSARQAIVPLIQAEEDVRFVRDTNQLLDEEAKVMANVPGWKVGESVYNSGRWMAPSSGKLSMDS